MYQDPISPTLSYNIFLDYQNYDYSLHNPESLLTMEKIRKYVIIMSLKLTDHRFYGNWVEAPLDKCLKAISLFNSNRVCLWNQPVLTCSIQIYLLANVSYLKAQTCDIIITHKSLLTIS